MPRNSPCWCGSGKKYKKCHYESDRKYFASRGSACKTYT
jgi:methionyl aminopeptidase